MSDIEITEVHRYYPNGIKRIIGRGGESYIGVVDESTVLKYPCIPGRTSNLRVESRLLEILGNHARIIGSKGLTDAGLRLEYAVNGDLNGYLTANPGTSLDQRLPWCRQAPEVVEYSHKKRVIHCDINLRDINLRDINLRDINLRDINLRNLLLDENLHLKLADF
jgi:hypothetical protein